MTTLKTIMTRAHEIARTLEGNYSARMSFSLKKAWAESKENKTTEFEKFLGFTFNHKNDRLEMTTPHVIKVKEVHNVTNLNSLPRVTLLIRLKKEINLDHLFQ